MLLDGQSGAQQVIHPLAPFVQPDNKVLILGSFPSVKSREMGFYYGHPQNRFWPLLSALLKEELPKTIPQKKAMLQKHGIALFDVVASCLIEGSSDASIRQAKRNDLGQIVRGSSIQAVALNGQLAGKLYQPGLNLPSFVLPSTSPANAAYSLKRLVTAWAVLLDYL